MMNILQFQELGTLSAEVSIPEKIEGLLVAQPFLFSGCWKIWVEEWGP